MIKQSYVFAAALSVASLGFVSAALASDEAATSEAAAPAASYPGDEARTRMEQRRAQALAERDRRYEELRQRATELGFEMPEAPWQAGDRAASPSPRMSREDYMQMRQQQWEDQRARAAEQGIELPEMSPWQLAQQRREEMRAQFEQYRETFEALTEEQQDAVRALFGHHPHMHHRGHERSHCPHHAGCNHPRRGHAHPGMMMPFPEMPEYAPLPSPAS